MPTLAKGQNTEAGSIIRSNADDASDRFGADECATFLRAGIEFYHDFQQAFDHFNDRLWDGQLPDAIIVGTRKKNVRGYFAPDRMQRSDGRVVAEIGMNSALLAVRSDRESLSTLVHEMAHLWRHYLGPLNRNGERKTNGYHCRVWAREMLRVGLIPSDTGAPGGKMTGYRMTHFIEDGGLFDRECQALLESGFQINWADRIVRPNVPNHDPSDPDEQPQKKDRVKFTCPGCAQNAWAKPSAKLACGVCNQPLITT